MRWILRLWDTPGGAHLELEDPITRAQRIHKECNCLRRNIALHQNDKITCEYA